MDLLADDRPIGELDHAAEARDHVGVVRCDNEREPELVAQCIDQVEHPLTRVRVQVPGESLP